MSSPIKLCEGTMLKYIHLGVADGGKGKVVC